VRTIDGHGIYSSFKIQTRRGIRIRGTQPAFFEARPFASVRISGWILQMHPRDSRHSHPVKRTILNGLGELPGSRIPARIHSIVLVGRMNRPETGAHRIWSPVLIRTRTWIGLNGVLPSGNLQNLQSSPAVLSQVESSHQFPRPLRRCVRNGRTRERDLSRVILLRRRP